MREDGDLAGVDDRAGVREQVCSWAFGTEHVRFEARIEMPDELGERRRRSAELRTVVDVEERKPVRRGQDPLVDGFDPTRVAGGIEVFLRMCARRPTEGAAPVWILEQLRDRLGDRLDAVVG